MIRLVLVDDQPAVRHSLRMRLGLEPDLEVVGDASTGRDALSLVVQLAPDVVLMDVAMPDLDGIAATAALHTRCPHSAVVILSIADDPQTQAQARAAGAVAFVEKSGATETLLSAIRSAARRIGKSSE
jgi:DNA-binding NarL/FixJ family response regulator